MLLPIPAGLEAQRGRGADWAAYLDRLPRTAADLFGEWELVCDGEPLHGFGSLVVPVTHDGQRAVLKIAFPDVETEHEALALQTWAGRGAVRMLRADPRRRALLLERLRPQTLVGVDDLEACEIVAGLYRSLHVPAPTRLRSFTEYLATWMEPLGALPRDAPIPHRLVDQAGAVFRGLADDPASTGTILHHDLHYENVLAGDRAPWLAIDPQPMSGDPHAEPAPMLWNRWEELGARGQGVRDGVRRRFHTLVDVAGLDEERARDWVVVRMVVNAYWSIEDAARTDRRLTDDERDWITRCIAVAKAVQE
jgi:streptomycin 6-kinase